MTEIKSDEHEIFLKESEQKIKYKFVLLAHGARPKLLSNEKFIFGIRDTESVQKFQENLKGRPLKYLLLSIKYCLNLLFM